MVNLMNCNFKCYKCYCSICDVEQKETITATINGQNVILWIIPKAEYNNLNQSVFRCPLIGIQES